MGTKDRCENCGPKTFWKTRLAKQECKICRSSFEFERLINQEYTRRICDHCCEENPDRAVKESPSKGPSRRRMNRDASNALENVVIKNLEHYGCSLSLSLGFFRALSDQGIVEIADCNDAFLVECVLDRLLTIVSQCAGVPKDSFVAV